MDSESSAFWALESKDVAIHLQTDIERGLREEEAEGRLREHGANEFEQKERYKKVRIFLRQLRSPLIFILIIAGIATLVLKEWFDAAIIFLSIGVNTFLGFYQENKAENALAHLRSYIQVRTRVIRGGHEREEDARDIVPGDVIHLTSGSRVPADARLVSANGLRVDEAILTGESLPVEKGIAVLPEGTPLVERTNMIFGGTLVAEGTGIALVTATGMATEFGKIAALVSDTAREETPIQKAVSRLAWIIAAGISVFVVWIFLLGITRGEPIVDMFLVSIAVAVGAIPEALPIGLTAILAVGVERLAKRKGIMRSLTAAETLGSTSVVMTDKTGTLTEANMKLVDVVPYRSNETHTGTQLSPEQKDLLALAVSGTDVLIENPDDTPEEWRLSGNPLEVNIIRAAAGAQILVPRRLEERTFRVLLPFNSTNKFSVSEGPLALSTDIVGMREGRTHVVLGAPDVILERSALGKDAYLSLLAQVERASEEGKRLLGVAVHHSAKEDGRGYAEINDLHFAGLLAFVDPVRKEVPDAMRRIEGYGVRVVMATGDLKGTARSVAATLGWNVEEHEIITGDDMERLSDGALMNRLSDARIFARVTPQDKLRIAGLFRARGEVVAMTGDGVNDAPSLKAVDIGIAVGSGSDVAKSVADLVLLDNNFNTIVAAIEEGKRVLRNIRKTFVYLMSNCLDELILIGGALFFALPLPLTAIQIIWVNFFTGGLPAIAFAFDNEGDSKRTGRGNDTEILNREVKVLTLGIGTLSSALLFVLYYALMKFNVDTATAKTFTFACFASYILFVAFSFRNLERPLFSYHPFSNKFLVYGVLFGVAMLGATLYLPLFQEIFSTTTLAPLWLCYLALWIVVNILLVEAAKWLFYRRAR